MVQYDESHWDGLRARRGLVYHLRSLDLASLDQALDTSILDQYLNLAKDEKEALELCLALTQDLEEGIDELVAFLVLQWRAAFTLREENKRKEIEEKRQATDRISSRREGVAALACRMTLAAGEQYMRRQALHPDRVTRDGRVTLSSSRGGTRTRAPGTLQQVKKDISGSRDARKKSRRAANDDNEGSRVQMKHLVDLDRRKDDLWWIKDLHEKRERDQMFLQQAFQNKNGVAEPSNANLRYLPLSSDVRLKERRINSMLTNRD